jgi:hypothetical protein
MAQQPLPQHKHHPVKLQHSFCQPTPLGTPHKAQHLLNRYHNHQSFPVSGFSMWQSCSNGKKIPLSLSVIMSWVMKPSAVWQVASHPAQALGSLETAQLPAYLGVPDDR